MSKNGTEARVFTLPPCDFCKDMGEGTLAAYDGRTAYGWAFMCEAHWTEHGPGKVGLGIGQLLVVAEVPEEDPDCVAYTEPADDYETRNVGSMLIDDAVNGGQVIH